MHLHCQFISNNSQRTKSFCFSVSSYSKCNSQFTWNHFITGVLVINDHAIGFVDIYLIHYSCDSKIILEIYIISFNSCMKSFQKKFQGSED